MGDWKFIFADGTTRDLADYYHIIVQSVTGGGMPPIRNIEQTTETADGAVHYQSVAGVRVLQFACAVQGCSLEEWHAKRREFSAKRTWI